MDAQNLLVLNQIERIILLKIKTIIIRNLKKEDIPEFEQIVLKNSPSLLLKFANEKIPSLSSKIKEEIMTLHKQLLSI